MIGNRQLNEAIDDLECLLTQELFTKHISCLPITNRKSPIANWTREREVEVGNRKSAIENPTMTPEQLKERMKQFALRVIRLVDALPKGKGAEVIGGQLLRSATSVAANYRAACRARSCAEFVARLGVVEEEADESMNC